jgi:cellulose synthase/poly-beta-1,6-N-acetylglucosamine synthase-like glycosyltransferase
MLNVVSGIMLTLVGVGTLYLCILAVASLHNHRAGLFQLPRHRFAIAIPAHNEEVVIGNTVSVLHRLDYPKALYDTFVVADHCTDRTAEIVRNHGAFCYERGEGPKGSKGAALAWLLQRIFDIDAAYDAVVIFDADTRVDAAFLRVMDTRLARGDQVIQGRHCISNPGSGWFAALAWAMMMVDNRFQNQGRANLNWSAKLMGDSVCIRADLLKGLGWSSTGLTEDLEFRLRLLLEGVRVRYEPAAVGCGEAPASWTAARSQRARWLRGSFEAKRKYGWTLLRRGLQYRDLASLDGAAQCLLPVYSTLTLISVVVLIVHLALWSSSVPGLIYSWAAVTFLLSLYPLLGLALEKAPIKAYLVILSGPMFILWRTWLSLVSRFGGKPLTWARTERDARV